jgi:predicted glycoside hydrolase/deacetylase ChbG (UPF0249 family)
MKTDERRLIVNADDLGRTQGINDGIFEAHALGLVTSATLMVAYPAAQDAAAHWARYPDFGIGLHVALTGGPPVLAPAQVPSMVDEQGRLPAKPDGLAGAKPEEVRAEVQAQFDRFRQLTGRLPTHLDSHHHSHRLPVVCEQVIQLAQQWQLPVRKASPEVSQSLRQAEIATTDVFVEDFFGDDATLEVLLRILQELEPGVTEVMCHPAHIDDELRLSSSYVDDRETELTVLTHPEARQALEDGGIHLTHFGKL